MFRKIAAVILAITACVFVADGYQAMKHATAITHQIYALENYINATLLLILAKQTWRV